MLLKLDRVVAWRRHMREYKRMFHLNESDLPQTKDITSKIIRFIKKDTVLCTAFICALFSAMFVPPSVAYLSYIDFRVICLLFCLMATVAGLQDCDVFNLLAVKLLSGEKSLRLLRFILVMLPFFSSMLITNDVALITFVPFTILVMEMANLSEELMPIVIMQTIAANLGSMATPVGNPQNLFLCTKFSLSAGTFFFTMLPYVVLSFAVLAVLAASGRREKIHVSFDHKTEISDKKLLAVCCLLFGCCLLSVFHILHYLVVTAAVLLSFMILKREILKHVDYGLLITFVCFFIFSGNLGEIPELNSLLKGLMSKSALITSAAASQFISNVPAAVLLGGFTEDWKGMLLGTDLGGLGTPVASLASLISLKFYMQIGKAHVSHYLMRFIVSNYAMLAMLMIPAVIIGAI